MHIWPLQDAKSRFSEVVELTLREGPQWVTRRGQEAVVIVSAQDYRRLRGDTPSLLATLLDAPRGKPIDISRSNETVRTLNL
jgi:prevent-host-death family protein